MSLTLRQVQIFLAVAQSDSISDAGAILGITKSAVSQAITDLETRLGVNLFERSKGRAVLSAEGRAFKSTADELVRRADDAEHFFQHPSHAQLKLDVTLSIGARTCSVTSTRAPIGFLKWKSQTLPMWQCT